MAHSPVAYEPPIQSLNLVMHGDPGQGTFTVPDNLEIVYFSADGEILAAPSVILITSWLRKNYESPTNVLLSQQFARTPQRKYRIALHDVNKEVFTQFNPVYVDPTLYQVPIEPSQLLGGGATAAGGWGTSTILFPTVQPTIPQAPVEPKLLEFSITLSIFGPQTECPNLTLGYANEFQVNPAYPSASLGFYDTSRAKLAYHGIAHYPTAVSGKRLDLSETIYNAIKLGSVSISDICKGFHNHPKTRLYVLCCRGSNYPSMVPGTVAVNGNVPGEPPSPLLVNNTREGVYKRKLMNLTKPGKEFGLQNLLFHKMPPPNRLGYYIEPLIYSSIGEEGLINGWKQIEYTKKDPAYIAHPVPEIPPLPNGGRYTHGVTLIPQRDQYHYIIGWTEHRVI
jgi:hypothetical protein